MTLLEKQNSRGRVQNTLEQGGGIENQEPFNTTRANDTFKDVFFCFREVNFL
jgi:hypothetical protein